MHIALHLKYAARCFYLYVRAQNKMFRLSMDKIDVRRQMRHNTYTFWHLFYGQSSSFKLIGGFRKMKTIFIYISLCSSVSFVIFLARV